MTWTQLLADNEVQRHKTSKNELDKLRAVIRRDLADASLDGASADRRLATAYNAALQAAKMAIACAGYRVVGAGHHRISFEVVKLAIGKTADPYSDYFDGCRRKRNVIDYDDAFVATAAPSRNTSGGRCPANGLSHWLKAILLSVRKGIATGAKTQFAGKLRREVGRIYTLAVEKPCWTIPRTTIATMSRPAELRGATLLLSL